MNETEDMVGNGGSIASFNAAGRRTNFTEQVIFAQDLITTLTEVKDS